jgi:hypothetical protein
VQKKFLRIFLPLLKWIKKPKLFCSPFLPPLPTVLFILPLFTIFSFGQFGVVKYPLVSLTAQRDGKYAQGENGGEK